MCITIMYIKLIAKIGNAVDILVFSQGQSVKNQA